MVSGILLDLSGVLYVEADPLPGAVQALQRLQSAGLPVRYVTNTTRSTRQQIMHKLQGMGFAIRPNEVFTAPVAARNYLDAKGLKPYLLVHPDLEGEFPGGETHAPDAVLVGDAGEAFTYASMNHAFRLLMNGAPLLAMGRNRYFKEADGLSLDAGPFVRALEYAADTQAHVLGKPAPEFFAAACDSLDLGPDEVVMVGDDVEADVNGATDAGLQGILVRTGKYRRGDEDRLTSSSAVVLDDIGAFVDWILED